MMMMMKTKKMRDSRRTENQSVSEDEEGASSTPPLRVYSQDSTSTDPFNSPPIGRAKNPMKRKPTQPIGKKSIVTKAQKEIRVLQNSTKLVIPKLPFTRLVKEILMDLSPNSRNPFRIEPKAVEALQEFGELHISELFKDAVLCAEQARRITLRPEDVQLARRIRGRSDVVNP